MANVSNSSTMTCRPGEICTVMSEEDFLIVGALGMVPPTKSASGAASHVWTAGWN